MSDTPCYVVAAGGTGGHLFPAQAFAKTMLTRGHRVVLMTDKRFLAFKDGFGEVEVRTVASGKLSGSLMQKLIGLDKIAIGTIQAGWQFIGLRPMAVIGFGGYPSFPTMLAALLHGIPTVLHEQNRLMGKTNRLLAGRMTAVATSFEDMQGFTPSSAQQVKITGNPVRPAIAALAAQPYQPPSEGDLIQLLVFGGSQGARVFSEAVPAALGLLPEALRQRVRITQQCRQEDLEKTQAAYTKLNIQTNLAAFFTDMDQHIAAAHLVICRAGASSIAEMTVAGKPVLYVPYPHAAEDHQRINAEYVVQRGAGWMVSETDLTPEWLAEQLNRLFSDTSLLQEAAKHARDCAKLNAAEALADLAESLTKKT
jgi:UDP-N-acetylglucosamine--N-acetylmuramyl-(pentapeptide) pyrophosphoryl-undecaprenol N-acetylglucosamine transferase